METLKKKLLELKKDRKILLDIMEHLSIEKESLENRYDDVTEILNSYRKQYDNEAYWSLFNTQLALIKTNEIGVIGILNYTAQELHEIEQHIKLIEEEIKGEQ